MALYTPHPRLYLNLTSLCIFLSVYLTLAYLFFLFSARVLLVLPRLSCISPPFTVLRQLARSQIHNRI